MKQAKVVIPILLAWLIVAQTAFGSFATSSDAVLRASGSAPTSKTAQTVKAESELKKLTEEEKKLKESIKDETINRSKLLAQKRADLKAIRLKRDESIRKEIDEIKGRKDQQAATVKQLKSQLSALKKLKNKLAITTMEAAVAVAQIKLDGIDKEYKSAKDKLSKSYQDYKKIYDQLTNQDYSLKSILDKIEPLQKKNSVWVAEMKAVKSDYSASIKKKDFLTAQTQMNRIVQIQKEVNANHYMILDYRKYFKSEYYLKIVNFKL